MSLITAPLAGFGVAAIRTAADFESAMTDIQVATDATADEMEQVAEAAQRIGADTTFSASEAADALINLTKNGIDLDDALGGVLDATVQLAGATKTDLAFAADTAAKAMSQFGAQASDLPAMMTQLFNASQASTMGVDDFAQGLAAAGGVAGKVGVEFSDFTTALTMTSSAFSSGADAGTSFKTFLTNLSPTTKEAKELAKELGLNFFDARGQMLPMRDIVGELSGAFGKLTEQQKIEAAQTLFGTDAMRTALSLAAGGVATWDDYAKKIAETGTMQAAAAAKMQGFWGAWESLKGAIENVSLAIGNSGLLDWATAAARGLADLLDTVSQLNPEVLKWGTILAGAAVATGPLLVALGALTSAVGLALTGLGALAGAVMAVVSPVGLAVGAIAGLGAAAYTMNDHFRTGVDSLTAELGRLWDEWDGTFAGLGQVVADAGPAVLAALGVMLDGLADWGRDFAANAMTWAEEAGAELAAGVEAWAPGALDAMGGLLDDLAGWASDFASAAAEWAVDAGAELAAAVEAWAPDVLDAMGNLLDDLAGWGSELAGEVAGWAAEAGPALWQGIRDWAPSIAEGMGYAVGYGIASLYRLMGDLVAWAVDAVKALGDAWSRETAGLDWTGAIAAGVAMAGRALGELVSLAADVVTEFGRGLIDGIGAALGVDLPRAIAGTVGSLTTALSNLFVAGKDAALAQVRTLATDVAAELAAMPGKLTSWGSSLFGTIIKPFADAYTEVQGNSIVPDMVREVLAEFGRLPAESGQKLSGLAKAIADPFAKAREAALAEVERITVTIGGDLEKFAGGLGLKVSQGVDPALKAFEELSSSAESQFAKVAKAIADSDWGTDAKIAALQDLAAKAQNLGGVGSEAADSVRESFRQVLEDKAIEEIDRILGDTTLTLEEQAAQIEQTKATFAGFGVDASDAMDELGDAAEDASGKLADIADLQLDKIFDDATLTINEQRDALAALAEHYVSLGKAGEEGLARVQPRLEALNQEIQRSNDVIYGVKSALAESADDWRGWGETAGNVTRGFTDSSRDALADFFTTGKLDLSDFGASIKRVFAEEAANVVVSATSSWLKSVLDFGSGSRAEMANTTASITSGFATTQTSGQSTFGTLTSTVASWASSAAASFGTFLSAVGSTFGTMLSTAGSAFSGLASAVSGWVTSAGQGFASFLSSAGSMFANMLSSGTSAFTSLGSTLSGWVAGAAQGFSSFLSNAGSTFGSILSSGTSIFGSLSSTIGGWVSSAVSGFGSLLSSALGMFSSTGASGTSTMSLLGRAVSAFGSGGLSTFASLLSSGLGSFSGILGGGNLAIAGLLAGFIPGLRNIGSAFTAFGSIASSVLSNILKVGQNVVSGLLSAFNGLFSSVTRGFSGLISGAGNAVQQIGKLFGDVGGGITGKIMDWMKTIGGELGKGDLKDLFKIFDGFGGFLGDAWGGIKDLFGGIGDFFGGIFHEGGRVAGIGDVPIIAEGGEYVVNPAATDEWLPVLEALNAGDPITALGAMVESVFGDGAVGLGDDAGMDGETADGGTFHRGGRVPGHGEKRAKVLGGEFVVSPFATGEWLDALEALNAGDPVSAMAALAESLDLGSPIAPDVLVDLPRTPALPARSADMPSLPLPPGLAPDVFVDSPPPPALARPLPLELVQEAARAQGYGAPARTADEQAAARPASLPTMAELVGTPSRATATGGTASDRAIEAAAGGATRARTMERKAGGSVTINGPVIASDLSMRQFTRKLSRLMDEETRRTKLS